MARYDLLVRGGVAVTAEGEKRADLAVTDGIITALEPELAGDAKEEVDARGLHLFPGLIDTHVHFNEPGRTHWEGFATGSRALAAGGGTVFFDMPLNASPPTLDRASFLAKKRAAEASSVTDFALWGGLTPANLERLPELAGCGVVGFKAFMSSSGVEDFAAADDFTLLEGMRSYVKLNLPVAVHAESESLTQGLTRQIRAQGGKSVRDYLRSRPVLAELEAVGRAILFAAETAADLHIVHVSTAKGVMLVGEARAKGVRVTCETCPHYLVFDEEDVERLGAVLKCAPPLRSGAERRELWRALANGHLDILASDHSPSPPDLKERSDFFEVWGGIAGVQSTLPALLTAGPERGLTMSAVVRLTSHNPAVRFGLAAKGRLEPGFDADVSLVDFGETYTLPREALLSRHPLSPYLGRAFRARVQRTMVRGKTVYEDGKITAQQPAKFIQPQKRI
jgi:allantoinase